MNLDAPSYLRRGEEDRQVSDERITASPLVSQPLLGIRFSSSFPSEEKGKAESKLGELDRDTPPVRSDESPDVQQSSTNLPLDVVETLASGTDVELLKRPPKIRKGRERDYIRNPTVLGRLILHQKFGRAMKRAFQYPEEASTWLCAKRRISKSSAYRPGEIVYTIRQLPIHIATSALGRTNDEKLLRMLNELISLLVFAYPEGAHELDHRLIRPIQEAVWYCAKPKTIALFLMARPEALIEIDQWGRTLKELNEHRPGPGKDAIQQLLDRDIGFWITAKEEASYRLQHNSRHYPSTEDYSIDSQSVLASPNPEEDTIASTVVILQPDPDTNIEEDETAPVSWYQLEQRATAAEQLLTTVNEENFTLRKQMDALTTTVTARHTDFIQELGRLQVENAVISEELVKLEQLLEQQLVSDDEEKNEQIKLTMAEISSLAGLSDKTSFYGSGKEGDPVPPTMQLYEEAKAMQTELSRKHQQQREKIRKLRHIVTQYIASAVSGDQPEEESSYADVSTISALTNASAKSDVTSLIRRRRWHINQGVVDRLPPKPRHPQIADNLSAILRFAASRHAQREGRHRARNPDEPVIDDLSVILRWAAHKDHRKTRYWQEQSSDWSHYSPIDARRQFAKQRQLLSTQQATSRPALPAMYSASELQIFSDSVASSGDQGLPKREEEFSAHC
jgi:hypothetical protein